MAESPSEPVRKLYISRARSKVYQDDREDRRRRTTEETENSPPLPLVRHHSEEKYSTWKNSTTGAATTKKNLSQITFTDDGTDDEIISDIATLSAPVSPGRGSNKPSDDLYQVQWKASDGEISSLYFSLGSTTGEIKREMIDAMTSLGLMADGMAPDSFILRVVGFDYYFLTDSPLQRCAFIQLCKKAFVKPCLELVEQQLGVTYVNDDEIIKKKLVAECKLVQEITDLIGTSLIPILKSQDPAVLACRGKSAALRLAENKSREQKEKSGNVIQVESRSLIYKNGEPMPYCSLIDTFDILVYFPTGNTAMKKILHCIPQQSVGSLKHILFKKFSMIDKIGTEKKKADDFAIKVRGKLEYLLGDSESLVDFDYIRRCLNKLQQPELSFVSITSLNLEIPEHEDSMFDIILEQNFQRNLIMSTSRDELVSKFHRDFRIRIVGVDHLNLGSSNSDLVRENSYLYIFVELYHGDRSIVEPMVTKPVPISFSPRWVTWLTSSINLNDLPPAARLCFTLFVTTNPEGDPKRDVPLGWVNSTVFDHQGYLRSGLFKLKLWKNERANPIGTCVPSSSQDSAVLLLEMENFEVPVKLPPYRPTSWKIQLEDVTPSDDIRFQLENVIAKDPLNFLTKEEEELIWTHRFYLTSIPKSLEKFLISVSWNDRTQVEEAYLLLENWAALEPLEALNLLGARFPDPRVRAYAVRVLEKMTDGECSTFLLQLIQVLKYEPFPDSELSQFLIRRAFLNRNRLGYDFFWQLKTEIHVPEISQKIILQLESYLRGCGNSHRMELVRQNALTDALTAVAKHIKNIPTSHRQEILIQELGKIKFPAKILLPIDPRFQVEKLVISKCKYMDSKKLPLWLAFENSEPGADPIYVIFKSGDDLRQDILTLQMLRLMDNLWRGDRIDYMMIPYKCVATGEGSGMLEVVLQAETMAAINKDFGGAMAVFKSDILVKWLQKHNPVPENYAKAVDRFLLSCAGYCVATYVLGIGDRHNDNIMLTIYGNLFHIDFGHFLGNFKKKFGVSRERAPFIFTPQYAAIMGGKDSPLFKKFVEYCGIAYNILRRHAHLFINLFEMMLSTGIPELRSEDDIAYLRRTFALDLDETDAAKEFEKNIYISLETKTVQLNDMVHVLVHNK